MRLSHGNASLAAQPEVPALFAYLTRSFWLVVQPLSLIVLLLVLAVALSWLGRRWPARLLAALALVLLFACSFTTLGYVLITPLEQRFARPAEPERIDGIVVLGGALDTDVNTVRGGWELNRSGDRFVETLRLALRHPQATILISGGAGALNFGQEPEALAARRLFLAFGIAEDRLVLDQRSRNTEENAQFAKALAGDTGTQAWLLVTSAFHMPRSVGLFRRAGFPVVPWPADYLASGTEGIGFRLDQPAENMSVTTMALREWTALAGYTLTGRIDELVPGP